MRTLLVFLAALATIFPVKAATTYHASARLDLADNYRLCPGAGPCAAYPAPAALSGWIGINGPLPASATLPDISSYVTGYAFFDGVNTFSSTDSAVRLGGFGGSTDASGNLTSVAVALEKWQTGTAPHQNGDYVAQLIIMAPAPGGSQPSAAVGNAYPCNNVGAWMGTASDACNFSVTTPAQSDFSSGLSIAWSKEPTLLTSDTGGSLGPVAATSGVTAVASTAATLNGVVDANGSTTSAAFEYGTTTGYGNSAQATPSLVNSDAKPVSANIQGLSCGTTYHYRAVAGNGSSVGADIAFSTPTCPPAPSAGTTYLLQSGPYDGVGTYYLPCPGGVACGPLPNPSRPFGWFTTAAPLAANLNNQNISALVLAFSFWDGLNVYSSSDPASKFVAMVSTDGSGTVTAYYVLLNKWQSGGAPHNTGDRVALIVLTNPTSTILPTIALNAFACTQPVQYPGIGDVCILPSNLPNPDAATGVSFAVSMTAGSLTMMSPVSAAAVPTLGVRSLVLLVLLTLVVAAASLVRKPVDGK